VKLNPPDPILYGKPLTFSAGNHQYRWDGKVVNSVTSILSILNKPALVHWAANTAVEHLQAFPDDYEGARKAHTTKKDDAGDIGKIVHSYAEKVLSGKSVKLPEDPKARRGAKAFEDWAKQHKLEPIALERRVMSLEHHYAGMTDYWGKIDKNLAILDFKTSAGMYVEFWLQTAAYEHAILEELYGGRGDTVKIERWLIHLDKKTGEATPYRKQFDPLHRDAFLAIRRTHKFMNDVEKAEKALSKAA
jgi:hypothetical protein